jgi:hypothetical protein
LLRPYRIFVIYHFHNSLCYYESTHDKTLTRRIAVPSVPHWFLQARNEQDSGHNSERAFWAFVHERCE